MSEPEYYTKNGLSPIGAFKQGLMSMDEYRGFLIGNIIKYTIRAGKKEDAIKDLQKAKHYIEFYMELLQGESRINNIPINITVNDDIYWDKFREDLEALLEDANRELPEFIINETPTDDPNIVKIKLSDAMYDDDGELKPEAREKIREHLIQRRQSNYD